MLREIIFEYSTVVNIIGFVVVVSAFYWKVRIDLKELDIKIAEITCDRKEKWAKYGEERDKQEAYMHELLTAISEMRGDIKSIKTNIDWLKKNEG